MWERRTHCQVGESCCRSPNPHTAAHKGFLGPILASWLPGFSTSVEHAAAAQSAHNTEKKSKRKNSQIAASWCPSVWFWGSNRGIKQTMVVDLGEIAWAPWVAEGEKREEGERDERKTSVLALKQQADWWKKKGLNSLIVLGLFETIGIVASLTVLSPVLPLLEKSAGCGV